jgi:hypothetical protein
LLAAADAEDEAVAVVAAVVVRVGDESLCNPKLILVGLGGGEVGGDDEKEGDVNKVDSLLALILELFACGSLHTDIDGISNELLANGIMSIES